MILCMSLVIPKPPFLLLLLLLLLAGGTDLPWSRACAQKCGFNHHILRPSLSQLLHTELPTVIQVLKSFDPMSLRNEIASAYAVGSAITLHHIAVGLVPYTSVRQGNRRRRKHGGSVVEVCVHFQEVRV